MARLALAWTVDDGDHLVVLRDEGALVIGRDPGCDIVLPDASVSRRHAEVRFRDGVCRLRHLSETNATYVNGRIALGDTVLSPGDALWLPVRLVRVVALDDGDASPPSGGA